MREVTSKNTRIIAGQTLRKESKKTLYWSTGLMSAKVISIGLKGLERKERVAAALHSMGFPLVDLKVTINLSPTEQKKNGPLFDLVFLV
ncbi:magnesium chelatase domain-containing protein [Virgibacillus sp. DJP39]|uniref:magnesium chelatase domain-containing protein n=1 Tax=Virgibacillus sp. DJP39 TaxID=3409790 RepID=UPI003BB7D84A